jgi:AICAR transformylase/IMP cyclohydrolase PurH
MNTIDVRSVQLIQKAAENHLAQLIIEVSKYDQLISNLEKELIELRQKEHEKFMKNMESQMNQIDVESKLSNNLEQEFPESFELSSSPEIFTYHKVLN